MSTHQKEWLSKWLPLIFTVASNLVIVAYGYGQLHQRIIPLEQHMLYDTTEKAMQLFVTRQEFAQRTETRDRELKEIGAKLDRLIEMHMKWD